MGATTDQLEVIRTLHVQGHFKTPSAIADIGAQALHGGSPEDLKRFLEHFGVKTTDPNMIRFGADAYIGPIFKSAGFKYRGFDIVPGPLCQKFDLNTESVPWRLKRKFDLVLNFGTTEHVMNQLNAFRVMHDLCKPGGLIYAFFIQAGYDDHGLVHYTDRFLDMLMQANGYEVLWEHRHKTGTEKCAWIVFRKPGRKPFRTPIDA